MKEYLEKKKKQDDEEAALLDQQKITSLKVQQLNKDIAKQFAKEVENKVKLPLGHPDNFTANNFKRKSF